MNKRLFYHYFVFLNTVLLLSLVYLELSFLRKTVFRHLLSAADCYDRYIKKNWNPQRRYNVMYLMACAPSEDSDQTAHSRSLICPPDEDLDPWLFIECQTKTVIRQ